MRAVLPPVGTKFADSYDPLSYAQALTLVNDYGVGAVLRYENLTAGELANLLDAKLLVGLLVTSPEAGYQPTAALAQEKYSAAVATFTALGVPATVSVLADLEEMGGAAADRIAYANAAAGEIASGRFDPAGYFGAGVGLTSLELYDLAVNRYLKGLSRVTDQTGTLAEPACGWVGYQVYPGNRSLPGGLLVDFGILGTDYEGRSLVLIGS
jgi:hypothetical protein